jgi:hypothetical protein
MDAFSYLSVLLSIIVGLGMAQVLTASGRLIRHRERVVVYWPPLVWAGVLLVMFVQAWWAMFGLRFHTNWNFFTFFIVLLQTVTMYMMSALVLPEEPDTPVVDLRAYYDGQRGWFFGFLLATLVVSVLKDILLDGTLPNTPNLAFHALLAAFCIGGLTSKRPRVHEALAIGSVVIFGIYIATLFARLA